MAPRDLLRLTHMILFRLRALSRPSLCLILGTISVESECGRDLFQHPGPARGICQIEPATEAWLWKDLPRHKAFFSAVQSYGVSGPGQPLALAGNIPYGITLCRFRYWLIPKALPTDLPGLAHYWKRYYNASPHGRTEQDFINRFRHYFGKLEAHVK